MDNHEWFYDELKEIPKLEESLCDAVLSLQKFIETEIFKMLKEQDPKKIKEI